MGGSPLFGNNDKVLFVLVEVPRDMTGYASLRGLKGDRPQWRFAVPDHSAAERRKWAGVLSSAIGVMSSL